MSTELKIRNPSDTWAHRSLFWALTTLILFFSAQLFLGVSQLFSTPVGGQSDEMQSRFFAALSDGGEWFLANDEYMFRFDNHASSESAAASAQKQSPQRSDISDLKTRWLNSLSEQDDAAGPAESLFSGRAATDEQIKAASAIAKLRSASNDALPMFTQGILGTSSRVACRVNHGETTGWTYVTPLSQAEILKSVGQTNATTEQLQAADGCAVYGIQSAGDKWLMLLGKGDSNQQLLMVLRAPESETRP